MKPLRCVTAGLVLIATAAAAQSPAIRSESLPPLQQQWLQQGVPPVPQSPLGRYATGQAQPLQAQPLQTQPSQAQTPAVAPPATVERSNTWLPAGTVRLQALDKVNAQSASLTIKVGASANFGSLTITPKACVIRPTDQPTDAAVYLAVTDSHPDSPGFNGWILENEPSLSMMENPIYDLRVTGCT